MDWDPKPEIPSNSGEFHFNAEIWTAAWGVLSSHPPWWNPLGWSVGVICRWYLFKIWESKSGSFDLPEVTGRTPWCDSILAFSRGAPTRSLCWILRQWLAERQNILEANQYVTSISIFYCGWELRMMRIHTWYDPILAISLKHGMYSVLSFSGWFGSYEDPHRYHRFVKWDPHHPPIISIISPIIPILMYPTYMYTLLLYMCMCMYMYISTYAYFCICTYIYVHVYMYKLTDISVHTSIYVYAYMCRYIKHAHTHVCICKCICICIFV